MTYTVKLTMTDPASMKYSADYFLAKDVSKEEAVKVAKKIAGELQKYIFFGFSYSVPEVNGNTEIYRVSDKICAQKITLIRSDGEQRIFFNRRVKS